ncbi:PAS domain-containing sensor histidine kinase [uncultured Massilia sp.]|uniref:sensor histidine kinase n=1 Tax=uncultured Massilia sp. TaxID=169973 RepID=UPI0025DC5A31|nr:ATP-binding protein [uncultured Massilia sp.]
MASDARAKAAVLAPAGAAAALAWGAGYLHASPRPALLCALAALASLAWLWRRLGMLAALRVPAAPAGIDGAGGSEARRLLDQALALEAHLEHAPIALFLVDDGAGAGDDGRVAPLNASARKLVAPGRASDPADLYRQLLAQPGGRRALLQFETERGAERGLAALSSLTVHGRPRRLAALMPVESELEAEALNAWRELVRVLTHEIMNSLTPVASLSRTARELLDDADADAALPADVGADLAVALDAIGRRADSLVAFVTGYRSLSDLAPARPEVVRLEALFDRVAALAAPAWRARGGDAVFAVEPASLELVADPGQLEQALLNLLKNAFEATAANPGGGRVRVEARLVRGARLRIEVSDDGPGVPDALLAHIFTPFFTTRKQGGGIGLAMVRHLVHANGGTVRYARSLAGGARFVIAF